MGDAVSTSRTILLVSGITLLLISVWPAVRDLGSGIYAAYGRNGLVAVAGDLLIYAVLFGVISWAAIQLGINLMDDYVSGRPATLIVPVNITPPEKDGPDGTKLAQLLSAKLNAIDVATRNLTPTDDDYREFINSQSFTELAKGFSDSALGGLTLIFSATKIGNAPVLDSLNINSDLKIQVSGTDLTPYVAWLINKFRRHDAVELTLLTQDPGRKLIWNSDSARSSWETVAIEKASTAESAIEEFSWTYAHSLAARSQHSEAFKSLTGSQFKTFVRAFGLFGDAIRTAGRDKHRVHSQEFLRVLTLLEEGRDLGAQAEPCKASTGEVPSDKASSDFAPVADVTKQWWEFSKTVAMIASLARCQDKANYYASLALALHESADNFDPNTPVVQTLQNFSDRTTVASAAKKRDIIFLTTKYTPETSKGGVTRDISKVRITSKDTVDVYEITHNITNTAEAIQAIQNEPLPDKARLVLDLSLNILKSPIIVKFIAEYLRVCSGSLSCG